MKHKRERQVAVFDGRKFRGVFGILAVAALSLCLAAGAETVTHALVTQMGTGGVKLYNVDADGTWTLERTIVANNSTHLKRSCRALVHNGVVYALDMIKDPNNDGTGGYVRKFSLAGEYLGNLGWFPGQAEGLCLSSDKKFLYIGYAFQSLAGQVDKMSLEDGSVMTFATGLGQIRQICTDGKGRLYTAGRNWGPITILDEATSTTVASVTTAAQGIAYDAGNDWLWWCQSGSSYGTMDRDGNILTTKSDGPMGTAFAVAVVNGRPCFGSYSTGSAYRLEEDGTFTTLASDLLYCSDLNEVPIDPIAQWDFDEPANASAFMNIRNENIHSIYPMGLLQSGATGVAGGCLYFGGPGARGEINASHALIPATNDFTITFWAGMPATEAEKTPQEQYIFSNYGGVLAGRCSIMTNLDGARDKICFFLGLTASHTYKIVSESTFADGTWHHVAVVRRAGDFEIWLDGALEGSVTCGTTNAIGQIWNWHIGSAWTQAQGQVQEGAFMDDLRVYHEALTATMISGLFTASTPSSIPTRPAAPAGALELPTALGTEVAHAYACDTAIGSPSLLVAQDNTYYLASSRGNRGGAHDQKTTLYKSTDQGSTWAVVSQCAVGNGALFESGGKLCLIGNAVATTSRVSIFVSDDAGVTWSQAHSSNTVNLWDFSAAPPLVANGRVWQAGNYLSVSAAANAGFVSFAVDGALFSDPKWVTTTYPDRPDFKGSIYDTLHTVLPGQMLIHNSAAKLLAPIDDRRMPDVSCLLGTERYLFGEATAASCQIRPFFPLPGSAKRFCVRYDETSQLYWAVTVAVADYLQLATKDPFEIRDTLAFYASPDLKEWRPCGVVATAVEAAFIAPTFDFDGSDLVLAYAVAADDGAGGARSIADGNYLAVRRVANFRTAHEPFEPGRHRVLMTDFQKNTVLSYYPGPDGQWYSAGEFATEVPGYNFKVMGIAAAYGRVYIANEVDSGSGHIFVFRNNGTFLKTITAPENVRTDNIVISKDGSYLLVADPFGTNAVWRYSIVNDVWTKLCAYESSDPSTGAPDQVRGLALASDGSFYAMGRNGYSSIRHFAADGSLMEIVVAVLPNDWHLALHLDEQAGILYYAHQRGPVTAFNLTTKTETVVESRYVGVTIPAVFDMFDFNGTIYVGGPAGPVHPLQMDGGKPAVAPFPKQYFPVCMTMLDLDSMSSGSMLLIK